MVATRQKFSSQVDPKLLEGMREIARKEGRQFQAVLEEAMAGYIEGKTQEGVRPEVKALYQASVERHHRLYELLAQ